MLERAHDLCTVNLHMCVHVCDMVARGVVSMHKRKQNCYRILLTISLMKS